MDHTKPLFQINTQEYEDLITILSIDGEGIKGIILGIILDFLESELQVICLFNRNICYLFSIRYVGISLLPSLGESYLLMLKD